MKNFYKINAPEILKVSIQECGEELLDIKKRCKNVRVATGKECPQIHSAASSFARKTVTEKLCKAQSCLPDGIKFKILEGYRPVSIQKKIFKERMAYLKKQNPKWNEERLFRETAVFVAPWENTPPHSTGGAIDLTLVAKKGKELVMGTNFKDVYGDVYDDSCFTDAEVSKEAKSNRKILIDALTRAGFVNYPAEWWHWSYGDRYWAFLKKKRFAIYGSVKEKGGSNVKLRVSVSKGSPNKNHPTRRRVCS